MIGLRFFKPTLQYQVVERAIGLRNVSMIQFYKGYSTKVDAMNPRIGYARDAAFTPQSKANVQNHNILKSGGS